jgi:dTDP-4-amino-4,6-dideoxygalactose transaminase
VSVADLLAGVAGLLHGRRYLRDLEAQLARYFGVHRVFLVSSGKAALTVILRSLHALTGRREVVIPAYTCFSVPAAVLKAGLTVRVCDIDGSTLDFDRARLEQMVGSDTLCIVASTLFGLPSELEPARAICAVRGAYLVEDAAQAMGAVHEGRQLGTRGDVGFFSLGRGKPLTCGSGGIIVTSSPMIAEALARTYAAVPAPRFASAASELIRVAVMMLLIRPRLYWLPAALPFLKLGQTLFPEDFPVTRLSDAQAGLLRSWERRLAEANGRRSATARYILEDLGLSDGGRATPPYLRLPLLAPTRETRDRLHAMSREQGLGLSLMYPAPITEIPAVKRAVGRCADATARDIADRLLAAPTHHLVSDRDRARICRLLRSAGTSFRSWPRRNGDHSGNGRP